MNDNNINYAILGNYDKIPENISDLDICVDNINFFIKNLKKFCDDNFCYPIRYEFHATGIRLDLCCYDIDDYIIFPGPDISIFPTWNIKNLNKLSFDKLLANRFLCQRGFFVPSDTDAFIYYFVNRIDKGDVTDENFTFLSARWHSSSTLIMKIIAELWPPQSSNLIHNAFEHGDWHSITDNVLSLRKDLQNNVWHPNSKRIAWFVRRLTRRVLWPSGFFVVFLGPDGSGKSSVIDRVFKALRPHFIHVQYFHLRPRIGLSKRANVIHVVAPHSEPPRGIPSSIAKIFYFLFDYTLGYFLQIFPKYLKFSLIIFDRYYYDLLVDPRRYRFPGPMWLAKAVSFCVPRPDLLIVLDAPSEILQKRKKEVSPEESFRQSVSYRDLARKLPNTVLIDASNSLDDVSGKTIRTILAALGNRTLARLVWSHQTLNEKSSNKYL